MLKDIEGAAESIHDHGTTIAVVRHPFLRLYSGLYPQKVKILF